MDKSEIDKKLEKLKKAISHMTIAWVKFQEALEETRRITEGLAEELERVDDKESSIKTPDARKKSYISKDGRRYWVNSDGAAEFG